MTVLSGLSKLDLNNVHSDTTGGPGTSGYAQGSQAAGLHNEPSNATAADGDTHMQDVAADEADEGCEWTEIPFQLVQVSGHCCPR